jgi:hypothetical protein
MNVGVIDYKEKPLGYYPVKVIILFPPIDFKCCLHLQGK